MEKNPTYYDLLQSEICKQNQFITVLNVGIESEINRAYEWIKNIGFEMQELREEIDQLSDGSQKAQKRQLLKKYLSLKDITSRQIDVLENLMNVLHGWEGWIDDGIYNGLD